MNSGSTYEEELVATWFEDMRVMKTNYKEPVLNYFIVDKIKLFCDALHESSHVFLTTVEILNNYVTLKEANKNPVQNPLLSVITSIYIAVKFAGEGIEIKLTSFSKMYNTLSHNKTSYDEIKLMEIEILETLHHRLPLHTILDDLMTLLEYIISPLKLNYTLMYLCEEILLFVTINKLRLFANIKIRYMQSIQALKAFRTICINRIYMPVGVLISAFKINEFISKTIKIEEIVQNISTLSSIHTDHLYYLGEEIYELYKIKTNKLNVEA